MKRCSWWVTCGFALLVLGLIYFGFHYWYAGEYVPDFPIRKDGKNFIHSPRSDRQFGALFGAGIVILTTAVISLIGVVRGPRTKSCLAAGLIAPAIVAYPFIANFTSDFVGWFRAL